MTDSLITRYRPKNFDEIWGHKEIVTSLKHVLQEGTSHSFLFTGPTGCGKTTLARLVAKHVNAQIKEVDAGQYTGIDDMRELLDNLRHIPLGGQNQCYILNEVQSLSEKAWTALLMSVEEPPNWLYWCLTTTAENKIPKALNRCTKFTLQELPEDDLTDLLEAVREAEGLSTPDNVVGLCARAAYGSPRLAISNFAKCANVSALEEANKLLQESEKPTEAIELIRALVAKRGWDHIQPILAKLSDVNPESIRHACRAYLTKAILGAKTEEQAIHLFGILEHFSSQMYDKDQLSPIVIAVGRILFGEPG